MPIRALILVVSIAAQSSCADDVFAQPVQRAAERYRSIRVLTDIPATAVIPTMAFMSNALGVTCLHCHTDVYESDEKPMKAKAREMIRLARSLNDQAYGGKSVVTCHTCHNGRAVPASTPSVDDAGWNKRPPAIEPPLPPVASVLSKFGAALGIQALDRLDSQVMSGTITRNSGRTPPVSDRFEASQRKPRTVQLSTPLSHPPEADAELPMTFLRPALLDATYRDLRVVRRDEIGGQPVVAVAGTSSNGSQHVLYFDERTGLLRRRTAEVETPLGSLPERFDFADYRPVDGLLVPFTIVWSRADYQVTFAASQVRHTVAP